MNQRLLFTKVVGVTFEKRQENISKLTSVSSLFLKREPENKWDPNAIMVFANKECTEQIGYISADLALDFAPAMDKETKYDCFVSQLTGWKDQNKGVNITIRKLD